MAPPPPFLAAVLWLAGFGPLFVEGELQHLLFYDYDPQAQRSFVTLGKTDNATLLTEGWAQYKLPALLELTKGGPNSLWCFSDTQNASNKVSGHSNPLIPCGGRDSAIWHSRLAAFGNSTRTLMRSGACKGVFLGDELMAAFDLSWSDLSYVANGLREQLGPAAILYENEYVRLIKGCSACRTYHCR